MLPPFNISISPNIFSNNFFIFCAIFFYFLINNYFSFKHLDELINHIITIFIITTKSIHANYQSYTYKILYNTFYFQELTQEKTEI